MLYDEFLNIISNHDQAICKFNLINIKNFLLYDRQCWENQKKMPQMERNYVQNTYLEKHLYSKYTKNSVRKLIANLTNEPKI